MLALTSGNNNIGIGNEAGNALTTGTYNLLLGFESGKVLTTGTSNISLGFESSLSMTTSVGNVAIGHQAGKAIATVGELQGDKNVLIGYWRVRQPRNLIRFGRTYAHTAVARV